MNGMYLHWLDDSAAPKPNFLFTVQTGSGFVSDGTTTAAAAAMSTGTGGTDLYAAIPALSTGGDWVIPASTAITYSMRTVNSQVSNATGTSVPGEMTGVCMIHTGTTGSATAAEA